MQIRLGLVALQLSFVFGCSTARNPFDTRSLSKSWFPSTNANRSTEPLTPNKPKVDVTSESQVTATNSLTPNPVRPVQFNERIPEVIPAPVRLPPPNEVSAVGSANGQTMALPDAIAMAFQLQPRLKASLESIRQAQGRQDIAFAAYLPTARAGYSVGGYDLRVGGTGLSLPSSPPFSFFPGAGAIPVGLDIQSGYGLAELNLQWLICDFGRRTGLYHQAGLAVDIAQLQTNRAYQTVANDVSTAYYQVLRSQALHRVAVESVRRAETDRDDAVKLAKGGVIENEKVLRAEVAVSQANRILDVADEQMAIAVAALNLAIGLDVGLPTTVAETADVPSFTMDLDQCLQTAVSNRREFQVAHKAVQVAVEGKKIAKADFAPRIVGDTYLNHFQQFDPRADADLVVGFIKLEWGLFEGGKRIAELKVNDSRVREAMAQAESIADTIAFQVNQTYHQLIAARKGIDRSRPAVDQSRETYRLVGARNTQGDATPAELTEAEVALTRAQQDYSNAIYDYLIAIARLDYAMGISPTPR